MALPMIRREVKANGFNVVHACNMQRPSAGVVLPYATKARADVGKQAGLQEPQLNDRPRLVTPIMLNGGVS